MHILYVVGPAQAGHYVYGRPVRLKPDTTTEVRLKPDTTYSGGAGA
jgi:hypothetical protein